jgi:ubiquinone/menaquinone biosynthesis C-methylase UbiE
VASGLKWGDVGCGTGALADTILAGADPQSIAAIDRADGYIAEARRRITDSRVRFEIGGRGPLIPGDPESEPEAIRSRQGIP